MPSSKNYTNHRLYPEFIQLKSDDAIFSDLYEDTEEDFLAWSFEYELDSDFE